MSRWEEQVATGRFELMPNPFRWQESVHFAHLLNGYQWLGFEALAALANERMALAAAGQGWEGTARELWACLFFEHRRWRHAGMNPPDKREGILDDLCAVLRERLIVLSSEQRAELVMHLDSKALRHR